jgi:hypothetical protein
MTVTATMQLTCAWNRRADKKVRPQVLFEGIALENHDQWLSKCELLWNSLTNSDKDS